MEGNRPNGSGLPRAATARGDGPLQPHTNEIDDRHIWVILSLIIVALAAAWLYHRALTFAFFNDDPTGHFAWMEGRTIRQFFTSSAEYGYYRPVVFTILRIMERLFGNAHFPHSPVADHALLVMLHVVNGVMVWLLAYRLSRRSFAFAWIAGLVFVAMPFSFEAVAYVASLTHPLHVFWVLLALLLFDHGRELAVRNSLVLSGLVMILALLTHENGLFIFPAMIGLDFVRRPSIDWQARARSLWPFTLPPLLFLLLWLAIPKNSQQGLNQLGDIGRNLLPFLQSLVFPVLPLLNLDAGDTWVLVLITVIIVAALGLIAWRLGALRLWGFALGWVFVAALPAALFLSPAYVYGSPRLSYLPAVGVAFLWAIPGLMSQKNAAVNFTDFPSGSSADKSARSKFIHVSRARFFAIALVGIYSAALVHPAQPFIHCQLDFYDETSRIARQMAAAATTVPDDQAIVFVNLPFFFSSTASRPEGCPNPYPWTPTGGILLPPYAQARDFIRFNGGPDRLVSGVTFSAYAPGWRTFGQEISPEGLRSAVAGGSVYVFDLLAGDFADLSDSWQPDREGDPPRGSFGEALALADARLEATQDRLAIDLTWRVVAPISLPLSAFIHVYDSRGVLVAQADGPPGIGLVPQTLWQAGDGLRDYRQIELSNLPAGRYTVAAGVYSQEDGSRLPATWDGQPVAEDALVIGSFER